MLNKKPIFLQMTSYIKNEDIEKEEEYYSKKLGRKVVILKKNVMLISE